MKPVLVVLFAGGFLLTLSTFGCGALGGGGDLNITVSTAGNQTTLLQELSLNIAAEVMHAGGNPAVRWSLSNCVSNCGSLSSTTANPVTYTAPERITASFNVTVIATAAANTSKTASVTLTIQPAACPSGNEAVLRGQYAFVLQGGNPRGLAYNSVAMVGSFRAGKSSNRS